MEMGHRSHVFVPVWEVGTVVEVTTEGCYHKGMCWCYGLHQAKHYQAFQKDQQSQQLLHSRQGKDCSGFYHDVNLSLDANL